MSRFFKEVATPETQGRQIVTPSGSTKDSNARQEALNESKGLGGAIQDLIGIASAGASAIQTYNDTELATMERDNKFKADSLTQDFPSFSQASMEQEAKEQGYESVSEMSDEEMFNSMAKIKSNFIKSRGLDSKEFLPIIKRRMETSGGKFLNFQSAANNKARREKSYQGLTSRVANDFSATSMDEIPSFIKLLKSDLNEGVGAGREIEDTQANAKSRLLQSIVKNVVETNDPIGLDKIKSKEFKEYFSKDIPEFDNAVNVIYQATRSAVNKQKQANFEDVSDKAFTAMSKGAFLNEKDVNEFIKEQQEIFKNPTRKIYAPDVKKMLKLKSDLTKAMEEETTFQTLYNSVKGGDFSVVERSDLKQKEKDAFHEKYFSVETGITDMSSNGILEAVSSGNVDEQLVNFLETGAQLPKAFSLAFDTKPVAVGEESLQDAQQKQVNAYIQANALSQETGNSINNHLKPESITRILHTSNTLNSLKEGDLTSKEAQDIISTFENDLKRNINGMGVYTSSRALESMDEERVKQITDFSTDAPWTTDDNFSHEYIRSEAQNNYNLMIDAGYEPDEAWERAQEIFEGSHKRFENPDGSEGVMPREFKNFDVDDMINAAKSLPVIRKIESTRNSFDKLFSIESTLAVHPVRNYKQSKLVQVYYNGKPIGNTQMSAEQMNTRINKYNREERKSIEEEFLIEKEKKKPKKKDFSTLMKETASKPLNAN